MWLVYERYNSIMEFKLDPSKIAKDCIPLYCVVFVGPFFVVLKLIEKPNNQVGTGSEDSRRKFTCSYAAMLRFSEHFQTAWYDESLFSIVKNVVFRIFLILRIIRL